MIATILIGSIGFVAGVLLAQIGGVDVDPTTAGGLAAWASVHLHTMRQTSQLKKHLDTQITAHVREYHPPPWIVRGEELERIAKERPLTDAEAAELESIKMRAIGELRKMRQEPAEYLAEQQARDVAETARDVRGVVGFVTSLFSRR